MPTLAVQLHKKTQKVIYKGNNVRNAPLRKQIVILWHRLKEPFAATFSFHLVSLMYKCLCYFQGFGIQTLSRSSKVKRASLWTLRWLICTANGSHVCGGLSVSIVYCVFHFLNPSVHGTASFDFSSHFMHCA